MTPLTAVLCLLLPLLLVSFAPLSSGQVPRIDYTQLTISSITGPQCTPTAASAVNCTLGGQGQLSVRVAGLPPNVSFAYMALQFTANADFAWAAYCAPSATDPSACLLSLSLPGYNAALFAAPLAVQLRDFVTGNTSQPFKGLWLAYTPPPVFTSISGCQGSGATTLLCVPDRDMLTFYGSGFLLFNALSSYQLNVGNTSNWAAASRGPQVLSDSIMSLQLNSSYSFILKPSHYLGVLMPVSFNLRVWSNTRQAYVDFVVGGPAISFAPIPPPIFLTAYISSTDTVSGFCHRPANVTANTFVDMIAETCAIYVYGHYLYSAQGSLTSPGKGTYPCGTGGTMSYAQYFVCYLPLIPAGVDQPGLAWDLLVQTGTGSFSLPGAITFTTLPVITSLVPCTTLPAVWASNYYTLCQPGSSLVLHTANFPASAPPTFQLSNYPSTLQPTSINVTCGQATQLTPNSWSCVIPATMDASTGQALYGQYGAVTAFFPSTNQATPPRRSHIVSYPDSLVITSVSGCEVSNGSLVVSRCRSGDVLTMTGSNLNISTAPSITFYDPQLTSSWACTLLLPLTATSVMCRLPVVNEGDSDIMEGYPYQISWYQYRAPNGLAWANPFTIAFTWDPLITPSNSGSSSSNVTAILVGVLVPVGVIAALVAVWLLYRHLRAVKRGGGEDVGRSDGFSDLEMK